MKSFDDNLESLDVAPRFLDLSTLAQLRRDSSTNRSKKDSSCIFLEKRERLESGDFCALVHDPLAKNEYAATFQTYGPHEKTDVWNNTSQNLPDLTPHGAEVNTEHTNAQHSKQNEEESVIDHKLTIERIDKPVSTIVEPPAESVTKDDSAKEEPKFVIKVKKTDTKITLSIPDSDNCALDELSEIEGVDADMQEERTSNMIFADEPSRLRAKIIKVVQYWKHTSLLIPNVFRALRTVDDDVEAYMELQDYSRKELLVQSNGLKFKSGGERDKNKGVKKVKKSTGAQPKKA